MRFFNVYGSRQGSGPYSSVISQFIERLKQGKPPVVFGDGKQTRDFVHVDNVVDATLRALNRKECVGNVINVGSGKETSIKELADILIRLFGVQGINPKLHAPRTGDIGRSCADLS